MEHGRRGNSLKGLVRLLEILLPRAERVFLGGQSEPHAGRDLLVAIVSAFAPGGVEFLVDLGRENRGCHEFPFPGIHEVEMDVGRCS